MDTRSKRNSSCMLNELLPLSHLWRLVFDVCRVSKCIPYLFYFTCYFYLEVYCFHTFPDKEGAMFQYKKLLCKLDTVFIYEHKEPQSQYQLPFKLVLMYLFANLSLLNIYKQFNKAKLRSKSYKGLGSIEKMPRELERGGRRGISRTTGKITPC